jgi:tRNA 2-thiocytidine biosynthesis protein TtcA
MAESGERLSDDDARELIASESVRVIDIRDDDAFGDVHIPGAAQVAGGDAERIAEQLDEGERVIVVCDDGERSAELAGELRERGFEASSVEGGMKRWARDRLPSQPSADPGKTVEPPKLPGAGV